MAAGKFPWYDPPRSKFKERNKKMSSKLFWLMKSGVVISVKWPRGWLNPHAFSADPDDHYRPELTSVVGKQGTDWDWRVDPHNIDCIEIKFSKEKSELATYFALKWT